MRPRAVMLLLLAVCVPAAPAGGAYERGAQLVSVSPERREQGDAATTRVDISGEGRFVVFETRARNFFADNDPEPPGAFREGGVFRRDLVTGALELVAYGDVKPTAGGPFTLGARNPSISDDGRWVVFSSAAKLTAADANTKVDVYARDMTRPIGDPVAFELISARDGGDVPASYGFPTAPIGAEITAGGGISADGRVVVFRTRAPSDLPAAPAATVPFGQVFVRDREAKTTVLVTRRMDDGTPAGGASDALSPAGVSADGSTVVWAGANAAAQAAFFPGEDENLTYYLWRRVADGPSAPTRRITGVSDPDDAACPPGSFLPTGDPTTTGPCWGPLALPEGIPAAGSITDKLPSMSADGRQVAFLTGPAPRPDPTVAAGQLDVYVTDMSQGVTRKAGTTELTRETSGVTDLPVESVSMSGDGRRIAFGTARTVFALPAPRLTTPPPVREGQIADLYVLDLGTMEFERVTHAFDGGITNGAVVGGVGTLAMSRHGSRLTFVSGASNLYFGDSNSAADAFVISEVDPNAEARRATGEPPFGEIGPPAEGTARSAPTLGLKVRRRGLSLLLTVRVPGAGIVRARARGRVHRGKKLSTVATGRVRVTRAGRKTFTVRPGSRYRRALSRAGSVRTRLVVTFAPADDGPPITARRTVTLRG